MKSSIAIIRGKFLNKYEMQFFEPLSQDFDITAFASWYPFQDTFTFPVVKLFSPMDLPEFPKKMSVLNRVFTDAQYLFGLEKKLRGFDLVHTAETYYHYTHQALTAKKRGYVKKVIATVLENIPFNNEGIAGRKELKQYSREHLDHIIALTERTKTALLLEGADEKKITVISHFIDTTRFTPKKRQRVNGSKPEEISILYCGRLETYKGVFELLYAIKLLVSDPELSTYRITGTFVGDGGEKQTMIAMERRLGIDQCIYHTTVSYEDMPETYRNADIYVAPSKETETWQEQYNTTLLEAQASGLPIITTRSGGIPENVGDAALLVQPGDVVSLVRALKQYILDESFRNSFGEKARARAETVHDITIGAKKLKEVYNKVITQ